MLRRSGPPDSRHRERTAACLPPILLALVALSQIYLAGFEDLLTPAKGGGFGLFSTVDKLGNRDIRFYLIHEAGQERPWKSVALARTTRRQRVVQRAMSFPTRGHLQALAREAATLVDEPDVTALRVEVWKKSFDSQSLEVRRIKVADYFLRIDAESP